MKKPNTTSEDPEGNFMKLKYFTIFLFVVCVFLIYRVVDLSITLDFTSKELTDLQSDIKIIKKYQGEKCSAVIDKIDGVSIFQKDRYIIIDGVSFSCEGQFDILSATDYQLRISENK